MGDQFQGRVPVNKIIPFSAVDGPGNRTAVFVQGCNFNCRYCHNPETRSLCRSCGECVEKCPRQALYIENGKVLFHPELCCGCDTCIKTCRFGASPRIRYMNAQEVYQEIRRQVPFIRGITVSGGECTLFASGRSAAARDEQSQEPYVSGSSFRLWRNDCCLRSVRSI